MKKLGLLLTTFFIFQFSQKAEASILLEPYLGYTLAKYDDGSNKYDANGPVYGFRFGYELPALWFALDFMGTKQSVEFSSGNKDGDASRIGVVAGITVPMGIRVWGGYYIKDEFKVQDNGKYSGSGLKVGVGFRLIPLLHLNFEYLMSTYDEHNGSSMASDDDLNSLIVSVSVPLSF